MKVNNCSQENVREEVCDANTTEIRDVSSDQCVGVPSGGQHPLTHGRGSQQDHSSLDVYCSWQEPFDLKKQFAHEMNGN